MKKGSVCVLIKVLTVLQPKADSGNDGLSALLLGSPALLRWTCMCFISLVGGTLCSYKYACFRSGFKEKSSLSALL